MVPTHSQLNEFVAKSTSPLIVKEPVAPANLPVPLVIFQVPVIGPVVPVCVSRLAILTTSLPEQ